MGFRLNVIGGSAWSISTVGDGATASVGIPALSVGSELGISGGAGAGWFEVTSSAHSADVYRCYYTLVSVEAGIGASLLGEVTLSGSTRWNPSAGSPIFRTGPLSPDGSGESGDPTGFLGLCFLLTGSAGVGNQGYGSAVLLGPPHGWLEEIAVNVLPLPARFKYLGFLGGHSFSTAASISVAAQPGFIFRIENRHRGNAVVQYGESTLRQSVRDMN